MVWYREEGAASKFRTRVIFIPHPEAADFCSTLVRIHKNSRCRDVKEQIDRLLIIACPSVHLLTFTFTFPVSRACGKATGSDVKCT